MRVRPSVRHTKLPIVPAITKIFTGRFRIPQERRLAIASQPRESLQSTIFGANPILNTATTKTIQIYLPTGEPRGNRTANITTRLVLAVLIPRSELATGKQRWELDHPGVYLLSTRIGSRPASAGSETAHQIRPCCT